MMKQDTAFGARVAGHYEAWYETSNGQQTDRQEKALLGKLLKLFSHADNVLEIGCGTGHFTRWLSDDGLSAVGVDLSAAMLAEARVLDDVPFVRGDAQRLPFVDGAFDLTMLITTLEFLGQPREGLAEALRVSDQGVILGVLNHCSVLALQRRLEGLFRKTVYNAAHFYSVGELKRLLRSIAGSKAHVVWRTTLFHHRWPWSQNRLPWGGFVGMALVVRDSLQNMG